MKNLILLLTFCLFCVSTSFGQMTLDHTFGTDNLFEGRVVNLSHSGKKFAVVKAAPWSYGSDTIFYYNLDYSLWKTIVCPPKPGFSSLFFFNEDVNSAIPISYSSETLFNTDTLLEAAVYYQDSVQPWGNVYIVNENGVFVDSILRVGYGVFAVHSISSSVFKATVQTTTGFKVFNLPGSLPCDPCGGSLGLAKTETTKDFISSPIPNPSQDRVKITFSLPEGANRGELQIYNTNGQKVKSYTVDNRFGFIMVDNSQLAPGMYFYNIVVNGAVSSTQKMLVIK